MPIWPDHQRHGGGCQGQEEGWPEHLHLFGYPWVHVIFLCHCSVATKISSKVKPSMLSDSGAIDLIRLSTTSASPSTVISNSLPSRLMFLAATKSIAGGVPAKRARILRNRERASSASKVSVSFPLSIIVNSSINPSNSVMRCVETNTVRWPAPAS